MSHDAGESAPPARPLLALLPSVAWVAGNSAAVVLLLAADLVAGDYFRDGPRLSPLWTRYGGSVVFGAALGLVQAAVLWRGFRSPCWCWAPATAAGAALAAYASTDTGNVLPWVLGVAAAQGILFLGSGWGVTLLWVVASGLAWVAGVVVGWAVADPIPSQEAEYLAGAVAGAVYGVGTAPLLYRWKPCEVMRDRGK